MAIVASVLSIWTQGLQLETLTDPQLVRTWPERLGAAGNAIWFYLGKLLWPHPLIAIYPPWQIFAGQWVSYLALPTILVILTIFWLNRQSWSRACFFAFAYFLTALLPVLGLFPITIFRLSLVFDHFQYLASIGPLALAGAGLVLLSNSIVRKKQCLQTSLCAGLLLTLGMASWQRTLVYQSNETFWTDAVAKNPDCWTGYNNLGRALLEKGQVLKALDEFQKALGINPSNVDARNNLGNALFQRGKLDEAVAQYQKALEINPNHPQIHYNFGNALLQKGEFDEAVAQFQRALEINPGYADAHYNFGNALLRKGKLDEAVAQFQRALEINPGYADARNNLGVALVQKGQLEDGIAQFQEVLRLKPDFRLAQDNLSKAQGLLRQTHGHE
jgi:tetratricopeptide (TPR) repeat protein